MNNIIFNGAMGDTITISGVLKHLSLKINQPVTLHTNWPEIFDNNPYVKESLYRNGMEPNLQPCDNLFVNNLYSCNCVKHYFNQLNMEYTNDVETKIIFNKDEITLAKDELKEFNNYKKIAVCMYSSSPARDVEYEYMLNFIKKIKSLNVKLIFFGTKVPNDFENIFDKFVVGEPYTGLRRVFSIMNECNLYLGVDTGLFHAAAAIGIPQVVFFRNNGCNVNAYKNTYYVDSKIECSQVCRTVLNTYCESPIKCTKNYDLDAYYKIIVNLL